MEIAAAESLIPGTFNARDLGGLRAGTARTRTGVLIRSEAPAEIEADGRDTLSRIGVHTAVDLREPIERAQRPVAFEDLGITRVDRPVLGDFSQHLDSSLDDIYVALIESRAEALTGAVAAVAAGGPAPVLFFCSAGKDRTGLVTALILAAVGVDEDEIVADYHRTERNMRGPFRERIEQAAIHSGITDQQIAIKLGAPEALIRKVLAGLKAEPGGAAGYLLRHGLDASALADLRSRLIADRTAARTGTS
jgi:protein-tyrosine phosphatase